jgi:hypothetical protein
MHCDSRPFCVCFTFRIHENPIGDEGVTILVQGLLKMYNALNPGQSSEDNDTRQSKNGLHATDSSATDSGRETGDATAVATAAGEDEEQRQDQSEVKASTDATAETTPNLASDSELDVAITGHSAASVDDSGHIEHEDGDAYGAVHENETREVTSPAVTDAVPGTAFTETKTRNLLNLRMLDIGACGMTSAGARCLAELIAANAGLTSLSLTGNKGVGIDGWESISQSLAVNVQLDTLELHHNGLGDAAVTSLVNGLSRNQSVITIDLEGNHIGSEGGRKIVELLQTAENLCNVHVRAGNNIPEDLVEEIEMLAESHG